MDRTETVRYVNAFQSTAGYRNIQTKLGIDNQHSTEKMIIERCTRSG